jgi:hypothetical protein
VHKNTDAHDAHETKEKNLTDKKTTTTHPKKPHNHREKEKTPPPAKKPHRALAHRTHLR